MTAPVLFQFMPPLLPSVYSALAESIREHGVQVPVLVDENGAIIDGHHRDRIASELGIDCPREVREGLTDAEKRTLAITLNRDRRHLTRSEIQALVAESLKADPDLSDRAHAQRIGVSPTTVGKVRDQVSNLDTSGGPLDQVAESATSATERIDLTTGEVITDQRAGTIPPVPSTVEGQETGAGAPPAPRPAQDLDDWRREQIQRAEDEHLIIPITGPNSLTSPGPAKVTGLDGKQYTRPAPSAPARRPLRDGFRDAALDLDKIIGRFERLITDDRYPRNRDEVARYANDLTRARDALDRLVGQMSNT